MMPVISAGLRFIASMAAGVQPSQIAPELDAKQVAALREFAEKQPLLSGVRREFREAASLAQQALERREADAAREDQQARTPELPTRGTTQQLRSDTTTTRSDRSDRDSYSRGR